MTHTGYGGLNTFEQLWDNQLIIVIIILNQIPLVLVDVIKENIHPLFKHKIRTSNWYIW